MARISFAFDVATAEFFVWAMPLVSAALRDEAPVRTGHLRDSIHGEAGMFGLRILGEAPVSTFVVGGTAPHDIYPRSAGGVLVFTTADGTTVFTRHVSHPGTSPNPFPQRGWRRVEPIVLAEVTALMGRHVTVDPTL